MGKVIPYEEGLARIRRREEEERLQAERIKKSS